MMRGDKPKGSYCGPFTLGFPGAVNTRLLGVGKIKEKRFLSGKYVIDPHMFFQKLARKDIKVFTHFREHLNSIPPVSNETGVSDRWYKRGGGKLPPFLSYKRFKGICRKAIASQPTKERSATKKTTEKML